MTPGLEAEVVDSAAHSRNMERLAEMGLKLPKISDLAEPQIKLTAKAVEIENADPNEPDPGNLFRIHWHNGKDRKTQQTP